MMPDQSLFHHQSVPPGKVVLLRRVTEALPPRTMLCPEMAADSGAEESWMTWPQKQDPVRIGSVVHMPGAEIVVHMPGCSSCFPE